MSTNTQNSSVVSDSIEINELIQSRRSKRAFDPSRPISQHSLDALFKAASCAPSAFNEQPWRFIYSIRETDAFNKLVSFLAPSNQIWAQHAGALLLVVAKKTSSYNGSINRHAIHDVGLAMGMLSIQATELGINVHQMGGFNQQSTEEFFQLPSDYEAITITAIGYLGNPDILEENLKAKELTLTPRKNVSEFAFENNWKP